MLSRIEKIMKNNGLNAKQFAEILGVGNSKITDWRNGKTKPTLNDIIGISQKFNVSSDYLIFGKESDAYTLSHQEINLINEYRKLDFKGEQAVIETIVSELDRISKNNFCENPRSNIRVSANKDNY